MKLNHKGKNVIKFNNTISVVVELEAYKKMKCYIDLCDKEIGWLGTAYKVGNEIRITDVFIFDQEVHATTCELTPGGIADFVTNLYMTMDADEAMNISNNLTCWGHSHVNMHVSPSGQDDIQLRSFSSSGHDWFLRVIGNKRGEFEYTYIDYNTGIEVKDIDWRIEIPGLEMNELKTEIKSEMKTKVREKKYKYAKLNNAHIATSAKDRIKYGNVHRVIMSEDSENYTLMEPNYFDNFIKSQQNISVEDKMREEIRDEEDILAEMEASSNHETIMDICGNNCDAVTDTEYQILDEALCQLTIDDLAYIGSCRLEVAARYLRDNTDDFFDNAEIEELHTICLYYIKNINKINGN